MLPCGHGNVCESDLRALWQEARQSGAPFKCLQGCSLPNCPPIDKLPYNWSMISAGDALEDLLAARDSSHSILSGAAKRAAQLIDAVATGSSSVPVADVVHNAHAVYRSLTQSYRFGPLNLSPKPLCYRQPLCYLSPRSAKAAAPQMPRGEASQ